jgi:ATP-dependent DNA helicase RecG
VGYVRLAGSGIKNIKEVCSEARLPSPLIKTEFSGVSVTLFKDIYTRGFLQKYGLEERHIQALLFIKENKAITNSQYRNLIGISSRTATNDLTLLVEKGRLKRTGKKGRGIAYMMSRA